MPYVIAVAVDGTPAGRSALSQACKQAHQAKARVVVLCTIDPAYAFEKHGASFSEGEEIEYPAAAREELAADRIIRDALVYLRGAGITASAETLVGSPAQEILAASARLKADMIVMGHRHLSWFDRLMRPSTCWDVLDRSVCPVLVSIAE